MAGIPKPQEGVSQDKEQANSKTGGLVFTVTLNLAQSRLRLMTRYSETQWQKVLIRVGYERVGDVPEEVLRPKPREVFDNSSDNSALKGVNARLDKLDDELAASKTREAELEAENAKLREQPCGKTEETPEEEETPAKPLTKDNYNEAELPNLSLKLKV